MSNIVIDIAAEFTGKKAFSDTDKATMKLAKGVKKLGAALGIAFSTRAILAYTKASVKAAAADQKSQSILATNLKNLGLAYANVDSEAFIKSMETQTHIADDLLRPAYAQLAQQTGSIAITQKIMTTAFDAANGAGLDFSQTVNILSQAYVGNRKGLKQLNIGLTQAELAALSFDELLTTLNKHFSGAGEAAVKGYAGQMAALNIAMGNVEETLGGALLDAFGRLAGNGDLDQGIKKIDNLSQALALLISGLTGGDNLGVLMDRFLGGSAKAGKVAGGMGNISMTMGSQDLQKSSAASAKAAETLAKKRAADLLAIGKKSAKAAADAAAKKAIADKKSADLSKAAANFDLSRISIAAALKATYDNDTRMRLLAMQAIEDEDGAKALGYLGQLKTLQDSVQAAKLAGISTISNASLSALNAQLLAELAAIDKTKMSEADKEAARNAAFTKYNDALIKQGGLAAANAYAELTQIQLVSIAKLAALQGYGAALATLNSIMVSNELAIATTQSANDLARYTALQDYITLQGVAYNAAMALAAANAAAGVAAVNAANNLAATLAANAAAAAAAALAAANDLAAALAAGNAAAIAAAAAAAASAASSAAAAAIDADIGAGAWPSMPGDSLGDSSSMPSLTVPDYGAALGGINLNPKRANEDFSSGGNTIIVNTGATLGTEQAIVEAVQTAIQTLNRRGGNTQYAGAIT